VEIEGDGSLGARTIQLQGKKNQLIRRIIDLRVPTKEAADFGIIYWIDIGNWWPESLVDNDIRNDNKQTSIVEFAGRIRGSGLVSFEG